MRKASLGATVHTVVGDQVPEALLDFAREMNATQLVVGTSRRSRWARILDEGIGAAIVQHSGTIDVHMVTHEEATRPVALGGLLATAFEPLALPYVIPLCVAGLSLVLSGTTGRQAVWRVACSAPPSCCRRSPGCGPRSAWEPGSHSASSRVCGSLLWGGD